MDRAWVEVGYHIGEHCVRGRAWQEARLPGGDDQRSSLP